MSVSEEQTVDDRVAELDLESKVRLLTGADMFSRPRRRTSARAGLLVRARARGYGT